MSTRRSAFCRNRISLRGIFGWRYRTGRPARLIGLALGALLLPAVIPARQPGKKPPPGPNILLVTFDTTRADHLSCYGYSRLTTPNIDRLASEGVLFRNAYSPIPLTGPAHISLMTSLFPQEHGATINGMHMSTRPHPLTLARIFRLKGYKTAAFISAWPLKKGITGLGRGFEIYNQQLSYHYKVVNVARKGDEVGKAGRRWLERNARHPFFLWVHYFDPHEPYELHSEYAELPRVPGALEAKYHGASGDSKEAAERIAAYDSEIAFDDNDFGKTLGLLEKLRLRERTLIVVAADHGESLGENGYVGHGDHIFQEIVHVPLIISYPKVIPEGKSVASDASLVDVMPTVLDYANIPLKLKTEGKSLKPAIEGSGPAESSKPVFFLTYTEPPLLPPQWISWVWTWAETKRVPSEVGFVQDNLKVITDGEEKSLKVYELKNQFLTEHAVADLDQAKVSEYRGRIGAWFKETNRGVKAQGHLSEEDIEMLKSLGYVNP
jgi:arylsulfatase A-like enzyme